MSETVITLIVDGALACLMVIAIFVMWRVGRAMAVVRESKAELRKIIQELNDTINRAESSIAALKSAVSQNEKLLNEHVTTAQASVSDLDYMIKAAERLADRLSGSFPKSDEKPLTASKDDKMMDDGATAQSVQADNKKSKAKAENKENKARRSQAEEALAKAMARKKK